MRILRVLGAVLVWIVLAGASLWACLALWIDGPPAPWLREVLVGGYALAVLAAVVMLRSPRRAPAVVLLFLFVVVWWTSIPPSNDRDWLADVARPPRAEIDGNRLTIHNLRNFEYRSETDFTEHWETRSFDLSKLRGVDLFFSFWGPTAIAHTITSWDFDDGQHLAISIETRKEKGEEYSAVLGFFRQYELYYVVADERDVIGVRTNHRAEHAYLYRIRMEPERAREILLDYVADMNRLADHPRWYNAATQNCTTTIRDHVRNVTPTKPWGWQLFLNGYLDQLAYERGTINTSMPFEELRRRSEITEKAKAAGSNPDFAQKIREGLPERPTL